MIKRFRVGVVQKKKSGEGNTVRLGNPTAKDPRYITNVEVIVKDANGNVLASKVNPYLVVQDPRKQTDKEGNPLSEERLAKIPDYLKNELYLVIET